MLKKILANRLNKNALIGKKKPFGVDQESSSIPDTVGPHNTFG